MSGIISDFIGADDVDYSNKDNDSLTNYAQEAVVDAAKDVALRQIGQQLDVPLGMFTAFNALNDVIDLVTATPLSNTNITSLQGLGSTIGRLGLSKIGGLGLFGGPLGMVLGSIIGRGLGSYGLSRSMDKLTEHQIGYNPDYSAWDLFTPWGDEARDMVDAEMNAAATIPDGSIYSFEDDAEQNLTREDRILKDFYSMDDPWTQDVAEHMAKEKALRHPGFGLSQYSVRNPEGFIGLTTPLGLFSPFGDPMMGDTADPSAVDMSGDPRTALQGGYAPGSTEDTGPSSSGGYNESMGLTGSGER